MAKKVTTTSFCGTVKETFSRRVQRGVSVSKRALRANSSLPGEHKGKIYSDPSDWLSDFVQPASALAPDDKGPSVQLAIHVRDYCDPTSFNAAVGPGTCVRDTSNGTHVTYCTPTSIETAPSTRPCRGS